MRNVFKVLVHPVVISIIGLIALSLLIWFVGPQIKFGEANAAPLAGTTTRLVCIMVLLMLWGLNNLWLQSRQRRSNRNLVEDLKQAPTGDDPGLQSQADEEMHQIGDRFQKAMETLKQFRFKGRRGNKALYELPWYIIVGPPGSGKTTALVNSGLEFPLAERFGRSALQGVGGTRNCDWWFTNEAVLIDTAGRYTTQDSHKVVDSSAWNGFLDLLRRNRRRRPINGAIVAISLQDLLTQTEDERLLHARTIRTRLDELMERLKIRFPVYLVFTKADLVAGFTEFFEDFGREEREQVWGVSLPNAPGSDTPPDFELLGNEMQRLSESLYSRLLWRTHHERDNQRRSAIVAFPRQFENAKSIAEAFVRQTFSANRFRYQPFLRGVYFTSGTQDGTPIDRLMASVAANFGFTREVSRHPQQMGKSYFLGNLFREVIFPEAELVGSNAGYERAMRWMQRSALIAMVLVLVGAGAGWFTSVLRHKLVMQDIETHVDTFRQRVEALGAGDSNVYQALLPLASLHQAVRAYDQREHTWLRSLGLYDARIDGKALAAYEHKLQTMFLPGLLQILETEIERGHEGDDLYDTFRIYMMFGKTAHLEPMRISDWFTGYWEEHLRGEASQRKELIRHLGHLLSIPFTAHPLDRTLVADTRALLLSEPVAERVYSRVRTLPAHNRLVDLLSQFGEGARTAFKIDADSRQRLAIPYLFTKEGYDEVDLSAKSPLISDLVNEHWVLTDEANAGLDFVQADLDAVSRQVMDLYLEDYIRTWDEVFRQLTLVEIQSLPQLEKVLAALTDPIYSPLLAILHTGQLNTELKPPKDQLEKLAAKNPKKGRKTRLATELLMSQYEGTAVDRHFRDLNALVAESERGPAPINGVLNRLHDLREFISQINHAPDPSAQAFAMAAARFGSESGNPVTAVSAYAQSLPDPVRPWLEGIARQSWKAMLVSARTYATAEWRDRVYRPYQTGLQGRYPLNRATEDEMALYDFTAFFQPGGTLDQFYQDILAPFVQTRGGWRNRMIDGYGLGVSSAVLGQFERAQTIREVYYRHSPDTIHVAMELRPRAMYEQDARFTLEVGEERLVYNHGPKFWRTVDWKASQDNLRVRLLFEDLQGSRYDQNYQGAWAWFRLLDASYIEKTAQSSTYLVTFTVGDEPGNRREAHRITYEVKAPSMNNPLRRDLLSDFTLPENL